MASCRYMDVDLKRLYDGFSEIRTTCTGIMGYLAMIHEGAFEGGAEPILKDLRAAAVSVLLTLEALRDAAARLPHGRNPEVDEAAAIILASEEGMRQSLQVLSAHLASAVPGMPKTHWKADLQVAENAVRQVAAMNDTLKASHAMHRESPGVPN